MNILGTVRNTGLTTVLLNYATINISQSSVRTIVSKLNTLFRHIGLLTPSQGIRIESAGFYTASIVCVDLDLSGLNWSVTTLAATAGRRQDRTGARHVDGHRNSRAMRNTLRVANVGSPMVASAPLSTEHIAGLAALVEGFNAFQGIDPMVFLTLQAEAE